jgi:hypothetical protein
VRGVKAAVDINVLDSRAFVCVYVRLRAYAHVHVRSHACTHVYVRARARCESAFRVMLNNVVESVALDIPDVAPTRGCCLTGFLRRRVFSLSAV